MAWYPGCGCGNWWNGPSRSICGNFEEPTVPDEGRCAPAKTTLSCEAPSIPENQCEDDQSVVIPNYSDEFPFAISARLFDQDCEVITDDDGNAITTITVAT